MDKMRLKNTGSAAGLTAYSSATNKEQEENSQALLDSAIEIVRFCWRIGGDANTSVRGRFDAIGHEAQRVIEDLTGVFEWAPTFSDDVPELLEEFKYVKRPARIIEGIADGDIIIVNGTKFGYVEEIIVDGKPKLIRITN